MNKILLRILFIIALIIAIALIALVVVRYSPRFFSYISSASASLFNVFKKEALELTVEPQTVMSGERVVISWSTDDQESVSLTYVCNDDFDLSYIGMNSTRMPIRCGEAFELGGTAERVTVIPTLTKGDTFNDIEITIDQKRTNDKKASGIAVITVTNGTPSSAREDSNSYTSSTTTRPYLTSTTTRQTSPRTSTGGGYVVTTPTVTGPANLSLSQPVYINAINPTVQFFVSNNGGNNTGSWELRASLPNGDIFNSGQLAGIPAGGTTLFTLSIGSTNRGSNTVRITVDPNNAISESNENDNIREVSFDSNSGGPISIGRADLTVRLLSIGYVGSGDDIGIRFEIRNSGGATAEDWYFEAELPTEDEKTFESKRQPDLKPGEAIEYTLQFNNPESNGFATIEVDSRDDVRESNENNNKLRFRVTN